MKNEDSDFSSLKTVSSFDRGENCTVAVNAKDVQHFSPSSLFVESLIEQLCKMMEKNPHNQKKLYMTVCEKLHQMNLIGESYEREEFQFMRSHYQKALYRLLSIAKSTSIENKSIFSKNGSNLQLSCGDDVLEWSRYRTEFKEIDYIARGGFGHVFKAQHKLDGEIYAVKKIFLRLQSVNDFLQNLREVKMLAKLNHPNIVAYKAAWLEPLGEQKKCRKSKDLERPALCDGSADVFNDDEIQDGSLEIVFEGTEQSVSLADVESESITNSTSNNSSAEMQMKKLVCQKKFYQFTYREGELRSPKQSAVLFIQMQLCQRTLRHWLDARNQDGVNVQINVDQCVDIFKKILIGVQYIHSQGIVHHDIKPSNIFISEDLSDVQVGDFGLSCSLLSHPPSSLSVIANHPRGQVGTKLYAAPEQLKGTCHPKSDVYSLGIVLFELLQPFGTIMERTKIIGQLRSGHIPTQLTANFPTFAKIISETVSSLKQRPSSSELLQSVAELSNADTVKLVAEQSELIEQLRRESQAKDEEIAFLRQRLEELMLKESGITLPSS